MMMVIERRAGRFMAGRRASMFRCFTRRRAGRFMAGSRASMFRSLTRALASAMLSFLHILDTAYELALALVTAGWRRIRMCTHHWIEGLAHITCWKLGLALLNVGQQGFHILATFTTFAIRPRVLTLSALTDAVLLITDTLETVIVAVSTVTAAHTETEGAICLFTALAVMMMVVERRAGRFMAGRRASMFRSLTRRRAGRFMAGSRASMFRSLIRS